MNADLFGLVFMFCVFAFVGVGAALASFAFFVVDGFRIIGTPCYLSELVLAPDMIEFHALAHAEWAEAVIQADVDSMDGACSGLAVAIGAALAASMGTYLNHAAYQRQLTLDRVISGGKYSPVRELALRRAAAKLIR